MTLTVSVVCLIVAAVFFAIAAWWSPPRGNLIAGGLFFLTLAFIASGVHIAQGVSRQDWIEALSIAALIVTAAGMLGAAWVIATDLTRWGR